MAIQLEVSEVLNKENRKTVGAFLRAYNNKYMGDRGDFILLEIIAKDDEGNIIGGIYGYYFWQWLDINILAVKEDVRKSGIGTQIMQKAEEEARKKGIKGMRLNTFSFQALGFYEKLGFKLVATEEGYPEGYSTYHLHKLLD